jgi:hypothetical protein
MHNPYYLNWGSQQRHGFYVRESNFEIGGKTSFPALDGCLYFVTMSPLILSLSLSLSPPLVTGDTT